MPASSALSSGGEFVPRGDLPQRIHQIVEPWASRQPAAPHRLTEKGLQPGDRLLLAGRLADRFPSNRVAMAGLTCFSVSAACLPP